MDFGMDQCATAYLKIGLCGGKRTGQQLFNGEASLDIWDTPIGVQQRYKQLDDLLVGIIHSPPGFFKLPSLILSSLDHQKKTMYLIKFSALLGFIQTIQWGLWFSPWLTPSTQVTWKPGPVIAYDMAWWGVGGSGSGLPTFVFIATK